MSDRDIANLRQFHARSQQPKIIASAQTANILQKRIPSPVNINIIYDSGFGGQMSQAEGTQFNYIGTSPKISAYEGMCSRRANHESLSSTFYY